MSLRRLLVRMLDPEGAPDGQGIFTSAGKFIIGAIVTGLTSADSSVTITDNGDGTLDLAASGGGGGGGGGVGNDRRWNIGSGETTIDEFDDSSLDLAWTRVDSASVAPAANVDWTEDADVLSAYHKAADTVNASHGLVQAIGTAPAVGDAWITALTILAPWSTNYGIAGLVVSDGTTHGAGKQVMAEVLADSGAPLSSGYTVAGSQWKNTSATVSTATVLPPVGGVVYVRLVYKGSNQWRADFSPNGVQWRAGESMVTQASFTPAYVGVYSRDGGSGTKAIASFEFLRRVSGVA